MRSVHPSLALLALLAVVSGLHTGEASAQTYPRTAVSSKGLDSNTCQVTLPCRSIGAALAKTNAGGEIIVLDSAGYGGTLIDKSVSIVAPDGIYAGVTVGATGGFLINGPDIEVQIKGFTIAYQSGTPVAVDIQQAASVRLENVQIAGFAGTGGGAGSGVAINHAASTPSSRLVLRNVTVRNSDTGLRSNGSAQNKVVLAENVVFDSNATCFDIYDGSEVTIRDSKIFNCGMGIDIKITAGATTVNSTNVNLDGTNMSWCNGGISMVQNADRVLSLALNNSVINRSGGIHGTMNTGAMRVRIVRSTFNRVVDAMYIDGTALGYAQVLVSGSAIDQSGSGLTLNGVDGAVNVVDSTFANNVYGIKARGTQYGALFQITRSTIQNNQRGIVLDVNGHARLTTSVVTQNGAGGIVKETGNPVGTMLQSSGDNLVTGNGFATNPQTPDLVPDAVLNAW
jgi:hypothetical protein